MPTSTTARKKPITKKENTMPAKATPARRKKPTSTPATEHPLKHLIPPEWVADEYISRKIDGFTDIEWLEYAGKTQQNVLMYGPTGPGKTTCVYAYAAKHQIPVVNIPCNGGIDPSTLFTRVVMTEDGLFKYSEQDIVIAMRYGPCIIYLDEVNAVPARNTMVLHGALDKRRSATIMELNETIRLNPGTQIIGTYNPDYEGTKPLNEAFNNRFSIQLEFAYDLEIEKQLITGLPVLLDLATRLRKSQESGDIETPVGPNMLLDFEALAWEMSLDAAKGNFLRRFKAHERATVEESMRHFDARLTEQFKIAKEANK